MYTYKFHSGLPLKETILSPNVPKCPFVSPFATAQTSPGRGEVVLSVLPPFVTTISHLSYQYPLKLLNRTPATPLNSKYPESATIPVHLYLLTYGGGLLPGDHIDVSITLKPCTRLVVTTPQGSTKIYKTERTRATDRGGQPVLQDHDSSNKRMNIQQPTGNGNSKGVNIKTNLHDKGLPQCNSSQALDVKLSHQAGLCYIPDPSQPFQDSQYEQVQRFTLLQDKHPEDTNTATGNHGPSLCILDWVTQGRTARGEDWDFHSWKGRNEVWSEDPSTGARKLLLRDTVVLEDETRYTEDQDGNLLPSPDLDSNPIPPPLPPLTCSHTPASSQQAAHASPAPSPAALSIQSRTRPHGIVGTLILHGPLFDSLASFIMEEFSSLPRIGGRNWAASSNAASASAPIPSTRASEQVPVTWTAARVRSNFVLVKFGAKDFESAKGWLGELMRREGSVVGEFGTEALGCL
ncbi:urease accessory protein UreD [Histoplasma capsulatum G186AR]|uniref:Urease accessory protein UreD n=2 Tax=Ajellomyces capsulatus TaxID=5037 RepID=C0NLW0_AJECG|nr:urease accessory protein UreD [Histoplasma capsulatum G186AR]EEH07611.1 urease accessory protein UreD [Histoplasma capsulatum G186AR]KAG5304249.1 urease accessory protein UreD [Histoplasma capsulatum]QSS69847.1 urease accessory protein UreD [Histoplasma capsulatum G186AR]